jgi:hypothetical protein
LKASPLPKSRVVLSSRMVDRVPYAYWTTFLLVAGVGMVMGGLPDLWGGIGHRRLRQSNDLKPNLKGRVANIIRPGGADGSDSLSI